MSYGIYYVVLKLISPNKEASARWGRYHLSFPSRYDADEFYRTLQTLKRGDVPYFTNLSRHSPQFWGYDSVDGHNSIYNVLVQGLVDDFRERLSGSFIHNFDNGAFSAISNLVNGPDWLDGAYFYIRNRHQPSLYWWVQGQRGHASERRRTKFRIQLCEKVPGINEKLKSPVVLIRKDRVYVEVVPEAGMPTESRKYLGIVDNCVMLSSTAYPWIFENLLCKQIGVRWRGEKAQSGDDVSKDPFLMPIGEPGAEQWELC
ncbi:hypothetical protein C7999DRAFT_30515 [Corynascus novoguineensis]|uniref:Uncharacterized protein n=1 Tax=Corynascus novoguineensis TaxID=1126955 RepID=A0AAN7CV79_9PEZI|nr:hypothetical protein C7999DRAFT_30515 [Corynascus novoguineensis]